MNQYKENLDKDYFEGRPSTESLEKASEDFIEEVKEKIPAYDTGAFKCLGDYQKCRQSGAKSFICVSLFIVCIGERLIPFAGIGK